MKKTSKKQKEQVKVSLPPVTIPIESVSIGLGPNIYEICLGDTLNGMVVGKISADPQIPGAYNCYHENGYPIANIHPGGETLMVAFKYDEKAHKNLDKAKAILEDIQAKENGYPLNEGDISKLCLDLVESQPLDLEEIEQLVDNAMLNTQPPKPVASKAERIAWIKTCVETAISKMELPTDEK